MPISAELADQLSRICRQFKNDDPNERLAAGFIATRLLEHEGSSWDQLFHEVAVNPQVPEWKRLVRYILNAPPAHFDKHHLRLVRKLALRSEITEDERWLLFEDIAPKMPVYYVKRHGEWVLCRQPWMV